VIKVLIVDDSATARRALTKLFKSEPDFEVVGAVPSGAEAVWSAPRLKPDLVSLDVFLPDEPAASIARKILDAYAVPIMLVSDAPRTAPEVFEALSAGALDLLAKPHDPPTQRAFIKLARQLAKVKVRVRRPLERGVGLKLVVIGSSTGGPGALRDILDMLPRNFPVPIAIAQHLAFGFEGSLAAWLSRSSALPVSVAVDGETLRPGHVFLGQANMDLLIAPGPRASIKTCPVRGYHPSADVLFESAARALGPGALGVVLTGVGSDGTAGARKLVAAGGLVFAQDRESSTVFGMPGSAIRAGVASIIGSPTDLARAIADCAAPSETPGNYSRSST
jgi:two-component system chemotaxis response regulator CheB